MKNPVILFIPVSSTSGIGEYSRSLIIASAIKKKWPLSDIQFVLNVDVPYFSSCPYPVHPCQGSATKDAKGVSRIIKKLKPQLVIFDASGRAQQFKEAKAVGAKVAFISQHKKKRSRGLKLNRLFNLDIHWVVQPDYCIAPLSYFQKIKLALFNKPVPKNVGAVYSSVNEKTTNAVLDRFNLIKDEYFIFNAGSGGHKSSDCLSADIYYQTAKMFYQHTKIKCVMVFGDNYPKNIPSNCVNGTACSIIAIQSVKNDEFIALLTSAKGRVISAGDTILQCIDLKKLSVAAAVSKDQPKRLSACVQQGLLLEASLSSESLYQQAVNLLNKKNTVDICINMAKLAPLNALTIIVNDIEKLIELK